jgi:hypothetical protein
VVLYETQLKLSFFSLAAHGYWTPAFAGVTQHFPHVIPAKAGIQEGVSRISLRATKIFIVFEKPVILRVSKAWA